MENLHDYSKILENVGPLKISIKELDYLEKDSRNVNALYAKVRFDGDQHNLLQQINEQLIKFFTDRGIY